MRIFVVAALAVAMVGCDAEDGKVWRLVARDGDYHIVEVDKRFAGDQVAVSKAVKDVCGERPFCRAGVWPSGGVIPDGLPLSDAEVASSIAGYTQNTGIGVRKLTLRCGQFEGQDPSTCFSD